MRLWFLGSSKGTLKEKVSDGQVGLLQALQDQWQELDGDLLNSGFLEWMDRT
jgi:hypothetical protein